MRCRGKKENNIFPRKFLEWYRIGPSLFLCTLLVLLDNNLPVLHNLRQGDLVVPCIEVGWTRFG